MIDLISENSTVLLSFSLGFLCAFVCMGLMAFMGVGDDL